MRDEEGPGSGSDASELELDDFSAVSLFGDCHVVGPGVQIVLDGRTITRTADR